MVMYPGVLEVMCVVLCVFITPCSGRGDVSRSAGSDARGVMCVHYSMHALAEVMYQGVLEVMCEVVCVHHSMLL